MTDAALVGPAVGVMETHVVENRAAPFSWGAALAGAVAATAVSFILISLGTGIGFLKASPYSSGPSLTTLTAIGAMWIVLAQAWGFAVGGYLAGRLRAHGTVLTTDETAFRDGAHGFVAWALGVVLTATMVALGTAFGAGLTAHVGATLGAGAAAGGALQGSPTAYYVDTLFRPAPSAAPAQPGSANAATEQERAEALRIFSSGLRDGKLSEADKAYLSRVVAARAGMSQEEANRRVDEVVAQANQAAKDAADKAAKAAAYLSFWTFMALLFGAVSAVVGGVVGGNQRDDDLVPDAG
jgi:hypothetical protein